ncbi:enoyl-CoA hydratase/isomerase family protein [Streptomyces atratus]|uniref:enoyl-CoA hydratase/isomerase family protein n=1 Tax=Streptomyces atratus TaxID=1893 RepID=UPI00198CDB8D|nr:enoyl-CoA hydratase/isomerase family protein [Streptomyces atratus]WPW26299.1 enoyl-CoA hydratase/isomerase family protein [Streptomyces atratus]GGT65768.1 enoyl-CoA hydratase [Streptomyces atratus]
MKATLGQRAPGVLELVVGDGGRRNALDTTGWLTVAELVRGLRHRDDLTALVIVGRGAAFCAGSDLREWLGADLAKVAASFAAMEEAFRAIEELPAPVVAQIDGVAAGAGCQLALACDLRVMGADSRIGMPIARLGILPSDAFAARLSLAAGPAVARELLYTGRLVTAEAAVRLGLANTVAPHGETAACVDVLVGEIIENPVAAVRAAKHAVSNGLGMLRDRCRPDDSGGPPVAEWEFQSAVEAFLNR